MWLDLDLNLKEVYSMKKKYMALAVSASLL